MPDADRQGAAQPRTGRSRRAPDLDHRRGLSPGSRRGCVKRSTEERQPMTPSSSSPSAASRAAAALGTFAPTNARHLTIVFSVALAVITYIDRICIAQAGPTMQKEMVLTAVQMGWVYSIFGW